jgi:hypothetical protein
LTAPYELPLVRLQASALFPVPPRRKRLSGGKLLFAVHFAALCLFVSQQALCQNPQDEPDSVDLDQTAVSASSSSTEAVLPPPPRSSTPQAPESEIIVEGLASYGNYRIFASGTDSHLYFIGVEYDRHSWGRFLKARVDYTAEVLPLILLDTAAESDIWGNPVTSNRKIVPGIGISPIGFRLMWLDKRVVKPYMIAKGGMLSFTQKELSNKSTYENFTLQSGIGVQVRMNERIDLRLGLFSDFHFSNGFIAPVDPGLDVMSANMGVSYHLGHASQKVH